MKILKKIKEMMFGKYRINDRRMALPINTDTGIELLNADGDEKEIEKILCRYYTNGKALNIEQLTTAEVYAVNDMSLKFSACIAAPKDIDNIYLEFNIEVNGVPHAIVLGRFADLDLTVVAEQLVSQFNPGKWDRMKYLIACIYAPIVRRQLDLKWSIGRVAAECSIAIGKQCKFEDIYSLYAFFLSWKESVSKGCYRSVRHYLKDYRRNQQSRKVERIRTRMQSANFRRTYDKRITGLRVLTSFFDVTRMRMRLWFYRTMKL